MNTTRDKTARRKQSSRYDDAEAEPVRSVEYARSHSEEDEDDDDHDQQDDEDESSLTEEQKKMKRILANRHSARASYQRRKKMMSELQFTVGTLSKRNSSLEAENKQLREEIRELRHQVRILMLTSNNSAPACSSISTAASELSLLETLKIRMLHQHPFSAPLTSNSSSGTTDFIANKLLSSRQAAAAMSPSLRSLVNDHFLAQSLGLHHPGLGP